jgi:hypothetical protein
MSSPIQVSFNADQYLVAFLEYIYGNQPITFPKQSDFNRQLFRMLEKPPKDYVYSSSKEDTLIVNVPYCSEKNVLYQHYLTDLNKKVLLDGVDDLFRITFHSEVNEWVILRVRIKDAIHLFMEKYGIDEQAFDMLLRDYGRYRHVEKVKEKRKSKKKSSDSEAFCPATESE